jgi:hypothetical protein
MDDPIDLKEREDGRDVVVVTTKLIKKRERGEKNRSIRFLHFQSHDSD